MESFAKFEHEGWQRVAGKYDSVWASSTRQFILPLLDAAEVSGGMSVPDVGCGPGYVSAAATARGAIPRVSARQDYLRARRRQGCKQFNPPSRNRFVATPRATALLFPKQRMLSRWARKYRMEKEEERKQRAAA